jgi:hypothetical protein
VPAVPRLCELYSGISLTTEEKAWKTLSYGSSSTPQADTVQYKNNEQHNTQKKNNNKEQYDVTEQYRTLNANGGKNTQQRKQGKEGRVRSVPRGYW